MCPYCKQRRFDVQYCNQCQFDGQYCNQDRFDRHVLTSVLIAEKTLPGTYVKIHITNSKPFKTSDLYDVVYKVIKIKFEQFHSYQYNLQAFEKHRSLLSTFSMLRYLVVMYLCAIDIYFASFYEFFDPRNEVVREYTGFTMSVHPSVNKSYVVR